MIAIYRSRAERYDRATLLLYLVVFRHRAYRREAVHALHLRLGETVVDLGCGTGFNFSLLQEQIGTRGGLIGVDLPDAMLAEAAARVAKQGWSNVELVRGDTVKLRGASEKLASSTRHAHTRKCMKTGCCNARSYEQT